MAVKEGLRIYNIPFLSELSFEQSKPFNVIILLHGLESSAHDFDKIVEQYVGNNNIEHIFVFPKAPTKYVTLLKRELRSWNDITQGDFEIGQLDWEGFYENVNELLNWIKDLKNKYFINKIIVGGFSQGGFNVWTGLEKLSKEVDGMAIFSTSLNKESIDEIKYDVGDFPFFYSYGEEDYIMPTAYCRISEKAMKEDFGALNFTCMKGTFGHEINQEVALSFWKWVNEIFE